MVLYQEEVHELHVPSPWGERKSVQRKDVFTETPKGEIVPPRLRGDRKQWNGFLFHVEHREKVF